MQRFINTNKMREATKGWVTLGGRLRGRIRNLLDGVDQRAHGRRCHRLLLAGRPFSDGPGSLPSEASVAAGGGGSAAGRRFFLSCGHCRGFASSPNPP
ncbi:hypothetical protein COCNU_contig69261632G000010 [Cocos nucifera]|nr:hypothetical protein [Cocos nucifera]